MRAFCAPWPRQLPKQEIWISFCASLVADRTRAPQHIPGLQLPPQACSNDVLCRVELQAGFRNARKVPPWIDIQCFDGGRIGGGSNAGSNAVHSGSFPVREPHRQVFTTQVLGCHLGRQKKISKLVPQGTLRTDGLKKSTHICDSYLPSRYTKPYDGELGTL